MTREEAINEIKSWAIPSKNGREVLETLIPELSKNDDESVRKSIIHILQVGGYMSSEEKDKAFAYLEKMKEANKAIEVVDRIDKYIDENVANAHDMKDSNPDKKYYRGWDDALGEMARILQDVYSGEKQKEHKKENLRDFIDDFPYSDEQKEQKPLTDEEKEYIRTIKSIISDFIRDKKPEDLAYYQRIYDWLDGRHVPFSCGHENGKAAEWAELRTEFNINEAFEDGKKEVIDHPDKYGLTKQKPMDFPTTDEEVKEFLGTHPKVEVPEKYKTPDFVFSKQEYEPHPIISTDTTSVKPRDLDGKALLYTADKSYQIGFRDGVASVKPAEWSESDKSILMDAICATEKLGDNEIYNKNNPNLAKAFRVAKDWLKSLPERFNLQPKQKWSEEDEKTINDACCWIAEYAGYLMNKNYGKASMLMGLTDKLKSLRPSWKPSDEQMEALKNSAYGAYQNGDGPALRELYEQLEKL